MRTKQILKMWYVVAVVTGLLFCGCSKSDAAKDITSSIEGDWYANSGNWSYTLSFYSDGTGEMDGHATSLSFILPFAYNVSGNAIQITGTKIYSDGDVESVNTTYTYSDGKIYNGSGSCVFIRY